MEMQVIEILRKIELFGKLNNAELLKLSRICQKVSYQAGKTIFNAGDFGDALYIIWEGKVEVIKPGGDEPDEVVSELGPQEIFGEMAFFENLPRSAAVRAKTDTHLLRVPADYFEKILKEDAQMALKVYRAINLILCHRLRDTTERLAIANRIIREASQAKTGRD
jgi:CRP-like cAMP-binding protein